MKKAVLLLAFCITLTNYAQQGINYKAILKDASGNILASAPVSVQFIIYEGISLSNNVYQESHTINTDPNGLIIVNIGEGTTTNNFANINWVSDDHFLNVQVILNGGTNYVDLGTTQFMAVPYAKHATTATTALNAGATSINDLSDGKSDNDGTNDGSSVFIGVDAGANDAGTDNQNVGVGYQVLNDNTTGSTNTANGFKALQSNTIGIGNTAIGALTLDSNITGIANTAIGALSLSGNTTGSGNTAIGHYALYANSGSGNVAIGNLAGLNDINGSNKLYIDNSSTSTPLIYGEFDTNKLTVNGDFKVTGAMSLNHSGSQIGSGSFTLTQYNEGFAGMYINSEGISSAKPFYGYATGGSAIAFHYYDNTDDFWALNLNGSDLFRVSSSSTTIESNLKVVGKAMINTDNEFNTFTDFTIKSNSINDYGGMYIDVHGTGNSKPFYGYAVDGLDVAYSYYNESANS